MKLTLDEHKTLGAELKKCQFLIVNAIVATSDTFGRTRTGKLRKHLALMNNAILWLRCDLERKAFREIPRLPDSVGTHLYFGERDTSDKFEAVDRSEGGLLLDRIIRWTDGVLALSEEHSGTSEKWSSFQKSAAEVRKELEAINAYCLKQSTNLTS